MYSGLIIDMDGVLYRGRQPVPGSADFLARAADCGIQFVLLSNVSEYPIGDLQTRLRDLGFGSVDRSRIITAAEATAALVSSRHPGAEVLLVGGEGLREELEASGLKVRQPGSDRSVAAVVVGKTHAFNYQALARAARHIRAGAAFYGANPDLVDPVEDGVEPACGALLAAVEAVSGIKPIIAGKPERWIMDLAAARLNAARLQAVRPDEAGADASVAARRIAESAAGLPAGEQPAAALSAANKLAADMSAAETFDPRTILVVGDRMDTDIAGGRAAGMTTALVLSGISGRDDAARFPYKPDIVLEKLADLGPLFFG